MSNVPCMNCSDTIDKYNFLDESFDINDCMMVTTELEHIKKMKNIRNVHGIVGQKKKISINITIVGIVLIDDNVMQKVQL